MEIISFIFLWLISALISGFIMIFSDIKAREFGEKYKKGWIVGQGKFVFIALFLCPFLCLFVSFYVLYKLADLVEQNYKEQE